MEPVFTDREVQNILNLFKVKCFDGLRDETLSYTVAKAVRDEVEDKLRGHAGGHFDVDNCLIAPVEFSEAVFAPTNVLLRYIEED